MEAVSSAQSQTLDNTLGAVFIGVVLSCILFGVSALQVYYYYHYYPHDSLLHKASVALLWVLDATHLSLMIYSSYHYGVRGFGQYAGLNVVIWPVKLLVAINVVVILLVQSLYAYRVWLLGGYHHGVLGYLVAGVVLGGFAIGIVLAYETYTVSSWTNTGDIAWAVESSFAASTMIDIVISVAMCYYLRKSKGMESRLNSRISTLMQYTLSCGVFTSACSIACLFTFILMQNNLVFLALSFLLTRLYVNSFMAMMNARQRVPRPNESTFMLSSPGVSRPPRSMVGDPEMQCPQDKYEWVDLPVVPALNSTGGKEYIPHVNGPAVYDSQNQAHAYAHQW
ncbi:hypothetical protein DFH08DRAFT_857934 [Mycena albidolilacea]|uniref:DUF6534 domain-containing protein n=1 Tax=Mycena albidolilacea TaxID=1033008 RepID=A0AAD7EUJ6_9AGAR|nr:hypothetical protein DFH08DRAFT_857934 [Mycena albidolilacea]